MSTLDHTLEPEVTTVRNPGYDLRLGKCSSLAVAATSPGQTAAAAAPASVAAPAAAAAPGAMQALHRPKQGRFMALQCQLWAKGAILRGRSWFPTINRLHTTVLIIC